MLRHFFNYSFSKFLSSGLNFVSSLILLRSLNIVDIGRYNLLLESVILITGILDITTRNFFTQRISKYGKDDFLKLTFNYWVLITIVLLTVLLTYLFTLKFWLLILILALLNSSIIPFHSYYISKFWSRKLAIREIIIACLKLITFYIVSKLNPDYRIFLFYFVITYFVSIFLFKKELTELLKFIFKYKKRAIQSNITFGYFGLYVLFVITTSIEGKLEIFLLDYYEKSYDLGRFSMLFRMVFPFTLISSAISQTILPSFSIKSPSVEKIIKLVGVFLFVGFIGMFLTFTIVPSIIIEVIEKPFLISSQEILVFSAIIPIYYLINIFSNYFIAKEKIFYLMCIYIVGIVFKFIYYFYWLSEIKYTDSINSFVISSTLILFLIITVYTYDNKVNRCSLQQRNT